MVTIHVTVWLLFVICKSKLRYGFRWKQIDNRTDVWYIYYIATLGTKSRNTVQRNIERL